MNVLAVQNLGVWIERDGPPLKAVDDISFAIEKGKTFALLGESGCGKSMTALSIMRLLPDAGKIHSGQVLLAGEDVLSLSEAAMRQVRGGKMGIIFQEPGLSLNPVLTVGEQIGEVLARHADLAVDAKNARMLELLQQVGIPEPQRRIDEYPFQFSGGMKQRVMIAMALAAQPQLLIADEPTTALDVTIQAQILELLQSLQRQMHMSMLLITHDLGVVAKMADQVGVMYAGHLVEVASRDAFFSHPAHPYSRMLFASLPDKMRRGEMLAAIPGMVPPLDREFVGCRFADRCDRVWDLCRSTAPAWYEVEGGGRARCHLYSPAAAESGPVESMRQQTVQAIEGGVLLAVSDLQVHFPIRRGLLQKVVGQVRAVDGISLKIHAGRTLALVGESGCGKTTAGKAILQLISPTAGRVEYLGRDLTRLTGKELTEARAGLQIVFQDPFSSLNPRMRIYDIIEEGILALEKRKPGRERIEQLLSQVGLDAACANRFPHEFSGGQRQRIAIARALAVKPRLLICDEPTSALDVSVQAQILNLLKSLQQELGLSYLFITHNLSVVEYLAHDVAVMYQGKIVEAGSCEAVLENPAHAYTRTLLAAVARVTPGR